MQRRKFVKLAPAAVVAASVPTTALAGTTSEEPCLRIVSRERVVLNGRSIEKIVVSIPASKDDARTTPFGSDFTYNGGILYVQSDGMLQREEGYPDSEERYSFDELHTGLLDKSINGWIELQWTDGVGHAFFTLEEGESVEECLGATRPARVIDLTKQR